METKDLTGQFCPYPVVLTIEAVEKMEPGTSCCFVVDDPLAVKSIPEELEEFEGIELDIKREPKRWLVTVTKNA